ncbi:reverse transcriptase domain-containing protein [Planomonospora venezuelensis]|nr:reverse transcriptase domain-containing protein [Planomonospora venezuelensis]
MAARPSRRADPVPGRLRRLRRSDPPPAPGRRRRRSVRGECASGPHPFGAEGAGLPASAGAGADDSQDRRETASAGDPDRHRSGGAGRAEAGPGTDFRGGLLSVLVWVFRPNRRAHDAIAEIHLFGSQGYRWVLDADIEACFDRIDHVALMDRVRMRVKDKRVLALVRSFCKAGIMTELGERNGTTSGTPQGGILSPLLASIALSVLDDFAAEQWTSAVASRRDRERRRHRIPKHGGSARHARPLTRT